MTYVTRLCSRSEGSQCSIASGVMHSVPDTIARTVKSAIISKMRAVFPRVTRMMACKADVTGVCLVGETQACSLGAAGGSCLQHCTTEGWNACLCDFDAGALGLDLRADAPVDVVEEVVTTDYTSASSTTGRSHF